MTWCANIRRYCSLAVRSLYQTQIKKILNLKRFLANLLGTHLNAPSFRPVTSRLAPRIPGLLLL